MSGKMNRLVTQEFKEIYSYKSAVGATATFQKNENFVKAAVGLDAARAEENAARARLQKERSMDGYKTGTENDPEEEEEEEISEGNHKQLATNPIRVSHSWEK